MRQTTVTIKRNWQWLLVKPTMYYLLIQENTSEATNHEKESSLIQEALTATVQQHQQEKRRTCYPSQYRQVKMMKKERTTFILHHQTKTMNRETMCLPIIYQPLLHWLMHPQAASTSQKISQKQPYWSKHPQPKLQTPIPIPFPTKLLT
mgnify:CR=1 FL=1